MEKCKLCGRILRQTLRAWTQEATCSYCDLRYCGLVRENKLASSFHFPDSPQGGAWPLTCGLRRECFRPDDGR